jgi:putative ABC transport system substrate-binding protein
MEEAPMTRRTVGLFVTLMCVLLVVSLAANAQQPGKGYRIGVLATTYLPPFDAFREGLRALGYVEGQNLALEYRWAEQQLKLFPELAADLVRRKVDVIVTWGTPAAQAAKNATSTTPIVMAAIGDAVGTGLVTSLARPGGNITGLSTLNPDLEGKRLQLLKEAVPTASRIAILWNPTNPLHALVLKDAQVAAEQLGMQLQSVELQNPPDLEGAFAAMTLQHADALTVAPDNFFVLNRSRIAELAIQHHLPAIYLHTEHVYAGGLMAYGPNYQDLFRRAATYVDKIFKGAKPGELPIEQPSRFELAINLQAAEAIGLTIPPSLLFQADKVIR